MKKFLSMVLALIMVLSLFTVGAGAVDFEDFADVDEIQYKAAVETMTELGILSGYDNGYFTPNGTISRGAAAKILAYIALGETKAEALTCVEAPFSDVAITSSVAPYIAWVAKEGIAIGYDNGTFGAKAAVSGHAYLKMVLGAMGIEGKFEGDGWRLNVTNAAAEAGLFAGIDTTAIDLRASATRELACQVAFNAMFYTTTAKSYEYIVYTNVGGTAAYEAATDTLHYKGTSASEAAMFKLVNDGSKLTQSEVAAGSLAYKNFGLTKTTATGEFKRPATVYTSTKEAYNTLSVADAKTPVKTYTNGVKAKALWTALGYTKTTDVMTVKVVVDGSGTTNTYTYKKGDSDFVIGGLGSIVEVYKTETAKTYDVVVIQTHMKQLESDNIKAAKAATSSTDAIPAYIIINGDLTGANMVKHDEDGAFETAAFAAKDIVLYTIDGAEIKSVVKATKVANVAVEKYVKDTNNVGYTTSVTVNGVALSYSATAETAVKAAPANFTDTYDFYLDAQGNIIHRTTASEAVSKDYVYVTKYQTEAKSTNLLTGGTSNAAVAEIVTIDGEKKIVELKVTKAAAALTADEPNTGDAAISKNGYYAMIPQANGKVLRTAITTEAVTNIGNWFAYTVNEDGTYNLKALNASYAAVVDGATLTKGVAQEIVSGKYTSSKTTVTAIDTKQVVTTGTGLVKATLTGKVLVTYAKSSATTVAAIYAAEQAAATSTTATEYVYALKSGAETSKGTEWTFAIDGKEVTYVVDNANVVSKGGVYTLSLKSGVATATAVSGNYATAGDDYVETNMKVTIVDEEYIRLESYSSTLYLGDKFATYCVETGKVGADTLVAGDYITAVLEKQLDGTYEILVAYITTSK